MRRFGMLAVGALMLAAAVPARALPGELTMMKATCSRTGPDAGLCRQIVDDKRVSLNDKRSCLLTITRLLSGVSWGSVKHSAATITCIDGLTLVGYRVQEFIARHTGAHAQR